MKLNQFRFSMLVRGSDEHVFTGGHGEDVEEMISTCESGQAEEQFGPEMFHSLVEMVRRRQGAT